MALNYLRQSSDALNEKSLYAVHAALGLSVSDVLLQGCQAIVVTRFILMPLKAQPFSFFSNNFQTHKKATSQSL